MICNIRTDGQCGFNKPSRSSFVVGVESQSKEIYENLESISLDEPEENEIILRERSLWQSKI